MTNVGRVSAARFRGLDALATTCVLANARNLIVMRSSNPAPSVPPKRGGAIRLAWMLRLSCRNHNPIAPRGGSCGLLARTWGIKFRAGVDSKKRPAHTMGANLNPPRPLQFTRRRVDGAAEGLRASGSRERQKRNPALVRPHGCRQFELHARTRVRDASGSLADAGQADLTPTRLDFFSPSLLPVGQSSANSFSGDCSSFVVAG